MPAQNVGLYALNRGEVSKLALARVDIERLRLSAEKQVNWLPTVLGPTMLRPGTTFIGETNSSKPALLVPFVAGQFDTALLELTDQVMRVRVDDDLIQRVAVSTTIPSVTSGSWTPTTSGNGTVSSVGSLSFGGVEYGSKARATGSATVSGGDGGKEHALRIVIDTGPLQFRVGSGDNLDDYVANTVLDVGTHSIAFKPPAGTFYATFETTVRAYRSVTSVAIEGAGIMEIPAPWAESGLSAVRFEQSADVLFTCAANKAQYRIERRAVRSWSIVRFRCDDGPFGLPGDDTLKFKPNFTRGNASIQSSRPFFKPSHVGGLIRLFHSSQSVFADLAAEDVYSPAIRVAGISKDSGGVAVPDRTFSVDIGGTWSGSIVLQRSFEGEDSGFVDWKTFPNNVAGQAIDDTLQNSIVWYRLGFKPGGFTSGVALVNLSYGGGGGAGVARITGLIDSSNVFVEVLSRFYGTTLSASWHLGEWSDFSGWPTSLALHEGRLWYAGASKIWGSVSDAYTSNDYNKTGDAGPINRTIGQGPIANISWILALTRLMLGADTSVITARSNSFDEPLTPSIINLKASATLGAALLPAVKVDTRGVFVHASGRRAYEIFFDVNANDYTPQDLTRLHPDILRAGVVSIAVQRQPDTRIHFVLADGTVGCLIYDKEDQVEAWWRIETDGIVERVAVLPGSVEDKVYYVVKRTINGADKRYIERLARIDECQGGLISKLADCHLIYDDSPTSILTGLLHLAGRQVVVWADGKDLGFYTVSLSGVVTLAQSVSKAVVGLTYKAKFLSAKLAYAAAGGTAINRTKRVDHIGFVLGATHYQGIKFGASEIDQLNSLPLTYKERQLPPDYIYSDLDDIPIPFNGKFDADSRVYFEASAPRPATIKAVTISITTNG